MPFIKFPKHSLWVLQKYCLKAIIVTWRWRINPWNISCRDSVAGCSSWTALISCEVNREQAHPVVSIPSESAGRIVQSCYTVTHRISNQPWCLFPAARQIEIAWFRPVWFFLDKIVVALLSIMPCDHVPLCCNGSIAPLQCNAGCGAAICPDPTAGCPIMGHLIDTLLARSLSGSCLGVIEGRQ